MRQVNFDKFMSKKHITHKLLRAVQNEAGSWYNFTEAAKDIDNQVILNVVYKLNILQNCTNFVMLNLSTILDFVRENNELELDVKDPNFTEILANYVIKYVSKAYVEWDNRPPNYL